VAGIAVTLARVKSRELLACISSGLLKSKGSNICGITEKRSSCLSSTLNTPYCFLFYQLRKADSGNF
jgi:hypothetical protein